MYLGFLRFVLSSAMQCLDKKQRGTRAYEQQHLLVIQYDTFSKYLEKETTELINLSKYILRLREKPFLTYMINHQ